MEISIYGDINIWRCRYIKCNVLKSNVLSKQSIKACQQSNFRWTHPELRTSKIYRNTHYRKPGLPFEMYFTNKELRKILNCTDLL